jgi:DNA polymerase
MTLSKEDMLNLLKNKVCTCKQCPSLVENRTQVVFDSGNCNAKILVLAEAPGREEDLKGEVLVGASGRLFNNILKACGWERAKDVYLCNILKCRPPGNRMPTKEEADNCSKFLRLQIKVIKPKVIICLGATASKYLLQTDRPISVLRGTWHEYDGIPVMPTFHPSYLLRIEDKSSSNEMKSLVWEDMRKVIEKLIS